jgi:hypothetical protein
VAHVSQSSPALADWGDPLRAITIRQPYPFLIEKGYKTVETRSRRCNYRGWFCLHAAAKWDPGWLSWANPDHDDEAGRRLNLLADAGVTVDEDVNGSGYWRAWRPSLPTGAITAVVELADCVPILADHEMATAPFMFENFKGDVFMLDRGHYEHMLPCQGHYGDFTPGNSGLILGKVYCLSEPVPCRGQQAVPWRVPDDVAEQVRAQLPVSPLPHPEGER